MGRWSPLFALAAAVFAQQEDVRIRTDVRQVLVPVVVTDAKGHHRAGLRAEDFKVYEDGVEQKVTSFSVEADAGGAAAVKAPRPDSDVAAAATNTTYVICFDTLHSSFGNFARIRDAIEKLFQKDDGSGAKYALVSLGRQLRVIQTATADRKLLLGKVRSKGFFDVVRGVDGGIMAQEVATTEQWVAQYCGTCPCGPATGRDADCRSKRQILRQQVNAQVERTVLLEKAFYEGLGGLVEELAKVPGSRTMIMVSEGFSVSPGAEFLAVASAYLPDAAEFRFSPETREGALKQTLTAATDHNIRIYSLDARGVSSPSFASGGVSDAGTSLGVSTARNRGGGAILSSVESKQNSIHFQNEAGPQQLAVVSGGVYYHGNNDFFSDLRSAVADGREYYLLAYKPANGEEDGKYRKITVQVAGQQKGVVRAKDGYWASVAR